MKPEERFKLIKEVGEEIITEADLKEIVKKKQPIAYDGFEPSGNIHIAQGLLRVINVNKMTKAGCKFIFLVADWHAWANNKLGGNLDDIQLAGKYYEEVWKACGMDMSNVEFRWVSDSVQDQEYWKLVMKAARLNTVARITRCAEIMGRSEKDALQASQILYPCMQAADIFYMDVDICQLGMDQRKVNVLAREIAPKLGKKKPVVVSHHMLMGLGNPVSNQKDAAARAIELKMSKSKPDTAIFMTDSQEEVERKMSKAYAPAKEIDDNPVMEYMKYIVFEKFDEVVVERPDKFGGNASYSSYKALTEAYLSGDLHPMDLKKACSKYINELMEPVRKHFSKGKAKDLQDAVQKLAVTR
ncbi:tyrosine--tRNA ligase [Nanoarchaeota archaeon]